MAQDDRNGGHTDGGFSPSSFDDLRIGDSYIEWLLTSGIEAARQHLPDPSSKRVRTPVLIFFDGDTKAVTIDMISRGDLNFGEPTVVVDPDDPDKMKEKKEIWKEGFFIPRFFFTFNEATRLLQSDVSTEDEGKTLRLVDETNLVMAFASDNGLKLWYDEARDISPLTKQIFDVFAGPPLQPFEVDAGEPERRWQRVSDNIEAFFTKFNHLISPGLKNKPEEEPKSAITAVIDDAFAFANNRFRFGTTSAFQYLWLQSSSEGQDFRRKEINDRLSAATMNGVIDEEAVYRDTRALDFGRSNRHALGYPATHGTPVLDLACGHPPRSQQKLDGRLIMAVEVPTEAVRDTTLARLHPYIYAGIIYLLMRSIIVTLKWRAKYPGLTLRPMVINISFGNTAGPHDGLSPFEAALDTLVRRWEAIAAPLAIVLGSGNSHLARGHARARLTAPVGTSRSKAVLPWRVLPDDKTDSAVEIWLPEYGHGPAERVRIKVLPPGVTDESLGTGWLNELSSDTQVLGDADGRTILALSYRVARSRNHYASRPVHRGVFTINLAPTESLDTSADGSPRFPLAPAGLWSIIVELLDAAASPLDILAWIQRDDTPFNFKRLGRQSYFDEPGYQRFDGGGHPIDADDAGSIVRRAGSMSAIATGYGPVVVAGLTAGRLVRQLFEPAPYSAGGPTSTLPPTIAHPPPHRVGPDVSAVSDDTRVHRGVMAAGTMGGSVGVFNGTSLAAPQVTRAIVELAQSAGAKLDRRGVRDIAVQRPIVDENGNPRPEIRVGVGRIAVDPLYPPRVDP